MQVVYRIIKCIMQTEQMLFKAANLLDKRVLTKTARTRILIRKGKQIFNPNTIR